MSTILIIDDEDLLRWSLGEKLRSAGHEVVEASNRAEALQRLDLELDVVLLDLKLPDVDGMELLHRIRKADPESLVIMMTAFSTTDVAVQAMREGAYDYIEKPFDLDECVLRVERALETTKLRREMRALRAAHSAPYGFDRIVGQSAAMRETKELLRKIAGTHSSTVLITGESGTGKDLAAKCIHYNGDRAGGPFMNITCSAVSDARIESALFGHEPGAFTDARRQKKGLLELADKGTVFLDEIGEMTAGMQSKVLRFLEDKTFKRVGGSADISPDVRIIAATNRDLAEARRLGLFREDLYYRLTVLPVHLPPLRDRREDLEPLVRHMIDGFNREFGKKVESIAPEALARLQGYSWPGNVRELRNQIERAMLLTSTSVLSIADLPAPAIEAGKFQLPAEGLDFEVLERDLVEQALDKAGGNQTQAATLLGMNRDQIRYRIEKFGLSAKH